MNPSNALRPLPARRARGKAPALVATCAMAALALAAQPAAAAVSRDKTRAGDPFEKVNRVIFYFNGALDFLIIRPAAITFKRITPRPIRTAIHNIFANMGEPVILINDVLQGHGKQAVKTFGRFALNSTVGVGGVFDAASPSGLAHHDNDFGITLARYGVKAGPYLVIPILGPATVRDGIGYGVNILLDPFTYTRFTGSEPLNIARTVDNGLYERAAADKDIKVIVASATDDYASIRSYYLQNREADISGGKLDIETLPDFGDPVGTAPASAAPPAAADQPALPITPGASPDPAQTSTPPATPAVPPPTSSATPAPAP